MKLSIALLAAPALAFAPPAQQARASVKVERRVEKSRRELGIMRNSAWTLHRPRRRRRVDAATGTIS